MVDHSQQWQQQQMDWDVVMPITDGNKGSKGMSVHAQNQLRDIVQVGTPEYNAHMEVVQVTDAKVKDAILQLACNVCAMWAVHGHGIDFRNSINVLTNSLFMYNQKLAPNGKIVEVCKAFVRDHEQRIGISGDGQ